MTTSRFALAGGVFAAALFMLTLPHDLAAQRQTVRIATGLLAGVPGADPSVTAMLDLTAGTAAIEIVVNEPSMVYVQVAPEGEQPPPADAAQQKP